jgi:hypothetical protein
MTLKYFSNYINTHKHNPLGVCIDALEDMIHHFDHPEADGYTSALVGDADVLLMRAYEAQNAAIDAEVAAEVYPAC